MVMVTDTIIKKGYKQTELGVIPEDWDILRLDETSKVIDSLHQTPNFVEDGFAMVRVADIKSGTLNLEGALRVDEKVFQEYIKNYQPKQGDIVLSRVGSYGISSFVDTNELFCMGQNTVVIVPNVDNKCLYYVLNSTIIRKQIEDGSFGSGYKSLSLKNIKELKLQLPKSKSEQTAIATVLSDTDALIEHLEKLIAKKKAIKQGAMQQLLTGKKRLPGFSGEWEVKKLGDIFSISAGGDLIKEYYSQTKDDKYCYPIYSNSLTNKGLYGFSKLYRHDENCITVTARGTIGVANARDHKFDAIGRVLILRPLCELNCFFVSEYLNNRVAFSIESTGVPQLTAPQISKYEIIFPGYIEQTAIATVLSDMDAEIERLEQKRDKYNMLKKGMMHQLLTGRIRIYANN